MKTIQTRIAELVALNTTKDKIIARLTLEDYSKKDIAVAMKEANLVRAKTEFRAVFHDWMLATIPSKQEAKDYIMGRGAFGATSNNVQKHLNVYMGEWELFRAAYAAGRAAGPDADHDADNDADNDAESADHDADRADVVH